MKTINYSRLLFLNIVLLLTVLPLEAGGIEPCGKPLSEDAIYRGVEARSNGDDQRTVKSCERPEQGIYGLQYQCVEFIRRFYAELGVDTISWPRVDGAIDFFVDSYVDSMGLVKYINRESSIPPAPDDIIVFAGPETPTGRFGHVAIVTYVIDNHVNIIEQNASDTGIATLSLSENDGKFTIDHRGNYEVLGWLRLSAPSVGLVAYYPLNNNTNDESTNGNHGIPYGCVTFEQGISGQAARFDGINTFILVSDDPSLRLNTFTISAWVNPDAIVGGNRILEKGNSNSYWLDINPYARAIIGFFDGIYHDLLSTVTIASGSWYFIAGTYDGGFLKIYINGVLNNSMAITSVLYQNNEPLIIGWKYNGIVADHFSGLIDEVRIYNRALSEAEIQALYYLE